MATVRQTISDAFEIARVTGLGRAPSAAQLAFALRRLNNLIDGLVGLGGSLPFEDVQVSASYEIGKWTSALRVLCQHAGAITVTLPQGQHRFPVHDGMRVAIVDATGAAATHNITLARNGWKIAGSAANATINTNSASVIYMFRADLGDWKLASDLGADDELPFPKQFDDAIALILADIVAPRFGQALAESDFDRMRTGMSRLRGRYAAPPPIRFDSEVAYAGDGSGRMAPSYDWATDSSP